MLVREGQLAAISATHSRFRYVRSPFFSITDFPWQSGVAMLDYQTGVTVDADLQAIYPTPVAIPANNVIEGSGWEEDGVDYYPLFLYRPNGSTPNIHIRAVKNEGSPTSYSMHVKDDGEAPMLKWRRLDGHTALIQCHRSRYFDHKTDADGGSANWNGKFGNNSPAFRTSRPQTGGTTIVCDIFQAATGMHGEPDDPIDPYDLEPVFTGQTQQQIAFPTAYWDNGFQDRACAKRVLHMEADADCFGFVMAANLHSIDQTFDTDGPDAAMPAASLELSWQVGEGSQATVHRLAFDRGGNPRVYQKVGEDDETLVRDAPAGDSEKAKLFTDGTYIAPEVSFSVTSDAPSWRFSQLLFRKWTEIDVRLIGGVFAIRIGNAQNPILIECPIGNARINRLEVRAQAFRSFSFDVRPLCVRKDTEYVSSEIPIGFRSERLGEPYAEVLFGTPGWDVEVDTSSAALPDLRGPDCQYRLKISGPHDGTYGDVEYSRSMEAVRAVHLFWLPVEEYRPARPLRVVPESYEVAHTFDPNTLQIRSRCALGFAANSIKAMPPYGAPGYWGEWAMATGQVALEIALGRNSPGNPNFVDGNVVYTGYGKTQDSLSAAPGQGWVYTMMGEDRVRSLMSDRWALPWMDGWNVFYAIAFLAQLGGVSPRDMGFARYVPDAPYGPGTDLGTPDHEPAYYLPIGPNGAVQTRYSGKKPWMIMSEIAFAIGYLLYFDALGVLQFHPFKMPRGVKRNFYESDVESARQYGGGMEGCWEFSLGKDMDMVRSEVITAGVDAFGPRFKPIVNRQEDSGVVHDPNAYNHLGYPSPFAYLSSLFGSESFGYRAALQLLAYMRNPSLTVRFRTWLQPDLFPMDVIRCQMRRSGTMNLRLMVTGIEHRTAAKSNEPASTVVTAQYIPEGVFG